MRSTMPAIRRPRDGEEEPDGTTSAGTHGRLGQQDVPRRDDVRIEGQCGPRRVDPDHPAALDAGINFVDTADVYGQGESEEIVGKAWPVGATTSSWPPSSMARWGPIQPAGQLAALDHARGGGLAAQAGHGLDRPIPGPPAARDADIDETLSALTDLVHHGKVRYIGHSTFPASQIVEAQWVARDRNLQRFVTEQPAYSMLVRTVEADVLPTCLRHGIGVISYSPLTGGWLSGRWRKDSGQQSSSRAGRLPERFDLSQPLNQRKLEAVEQLAQLADEADVTLIELAIAFVLYHPAITAAIIGPRTMDHLVSQLAAADVVVPMTFSIASTRLSRPEPPSTPSTTPSPTRTSNHQRAAGDPRWLGERLEVLGPADRSRAETAAAWLVSARSTTCEARR